MLADNEVDCKKQISAMKAEELVRANLAEAEYRAHLENLKHKECIQTDDVLDLTIIDNEHRFTQSSAESLEKIKSKKNRNQRANTKRKKNEDPFLEC
jgi:hypothetical protein